MKEMKQNKNMNEITKQKKTLSKIINNLQSYPKEATLFFFFYCFFEVDLKKKPPLDEQRKSFT